MACAGFASVEKEKREREKESMHRKKREGDSILVVIFPNLFCSVLSCSIHGPPTIAHTDSSGVGSLLRVKVKPCPVCVSSLCA